MHSLNLPKLKVLSLKNCKQFTTLSFYNLHNTNVFNNLDSLFIDNARMEIKVETKRLFKN